MHVVEAATGSVVVLRTGRDGEANGGARDRQASCAAGGGMEEEQDRG